MKSGSLLNYVIQLEDTLSTSQTKPTSGERRRAWTQLIHLSKRRGYVTHDEIKACITADRIGDDELDSLTTRFNEDGIAVYECAPDAQSSLITLGSPLPPIGCSVSFSFVCDMKWDDLERLSDDDVRFCDRCSKEVFYCRTHSDVAKSESLGRCVAIHQPK